ncbi:MAG TPA: hypothetical protein VKS81_04045 [Bacteroidota bacterium]|nr:hypothetical protein [Bacteroidota bacterium]
MVILIVIFGALNILIGAFEVFDNGHSSGLRRGRIVLLFLSGCLAIVLAISQEHESGDVEHSQVRLEQKNDSLLRISNDQEKLLEDANKQILFRGQENIQMQHSIDSLRVELAPFVQMAKSKFPDLDVQEALKKLQVDVNEAKAMAEPNSLTKCNIEGKKLESGYGFQVDFSSVKDEPIGSFDFKVALRTNSSQRIMSVSPGNSAMMNIRTGTPSVDGHFCEVSFDLPGSGTPIIQVQLSGITDIQITGKKINGAFLISPEKLNRALSGVVEIPILTEKP